MKHYDAIYTDGHVVVDMEDDDESDAVHVLSRKKAKATRTDGLAYRTDSTDVIVSTPQYSKPHLSLFSLSKGIRGDVKQPTMTLFSLSNAIRRSKS